VIVFVGGDSSGYEKLFQGFLPEGTTLTYTIDLYSVSVQKYLHVMAARHVTGMCVMIKPILNKRRVEKIRCPI
jgi:hypothetical protein